MATQNAAAPVRSMDGRLGCSTISFRSLPLADALSRIVGLGFGEIDLGALPGTCDHVPTPLPAERGDVIAGQVRDSGLAVRLINADVADRDDPALDEPELRRRLATLVELATAVGTSTIMLPSGRKGTTPRTELRRDIATVARTITTAAGIVGEAGLSLLVEAPYSNRLCADLDRAGMLYDALGEAPVGAVLDDSHVVAVGDDPVDAVARLGDRIRHVHLRDAVPGQINLSIGRGAVDFPAAIGALTAAGYRGHYSLELETRDIDDADRPAETGRAGRYITALLQTTDRS
jgi:sugar phosphate isomerase/epimerase